MKKKISIISGVTIFMMVLTANIQYALEGYGIGENSLHAEVLAQTSSGGGTSGGGTTGCGTGGGSSSGGSGCQELCSARVDCSSGGSYVSCKGYNPNFTCKFNVLELWVECDGLRYYVIC